MKITCCATIVFKKMKRGSIPLGSTTKVIPWMFFIQGILILTTYFYIFLVLICAYSVTFITC